MPDLLPNRFPGTPDRIIATSGRKARTAEYIGAPHVRTNAIDTSSATPTKCAVGPSSEARRPSLNITGGNKADDARRVRLIHLNRQKLLI